MIPKLRKKFISITAAALFAVILIVITIINTVFIMDSNRNLNARLERVMDEREPEFQRPGGPEKPFPPFDMKLKIRFDGCVVYLSDDGAIKEIRQDTPGHYSREELQNIADDISRRDKETGWYQYYKFRLETRTLQDGSTELVLGLVNASSDLYSVITMLLISGVTGIFIFLPVLLIILFASGRAVKPIEESYARQKQFVTDAGHELKTPLTVISANNALSRMIYGDCEWFDGIDSQVAKMNGLVRSLIALARLDEEQTPVFAPFDISDAVYDTAKSFENLIHTSGKIITFDMTENLIYSGDESKIRQLISILVDNAVKYCDANGKIAIRLTGERKQICLQVINDYAAAAECDFSRVFERFYRADRARTPDGSYGLGLAIAKSIVELHRGEIRAKAMPHGRISFEVMLSRAASFR